MTLEKCTPICIASPVRRSGTTLLQRLLCSSPNALIYGESCANDFQLLFNILSNKQMLLQQNKAWYNQQLQTVLQGQVNNWTPDLMPDIDNYLNAYRTMISSLANHYQSSASKEGRPYWGMKMPEWLPSGLVLLQNYLPNSKIIYLHRNLKDCIRSAKKIDMIRDLHEIQRFCQTWKQYSAYAKQYLNNDNVLHLNYEDLLNEPERWISEIEKFTGVKQVDRKVMNVKVNTYDNDPKLDTEKGNYLEPATLTKEELQLVATFSEGVLVTE